MCCETVRDYEGCLSQSQRVRAGVFSLHKLPHFGPANVVRLDVYCDEVLQDER